MTRAAPGRDRAVRLSRTTPDRSPHGRRGSAASRMGAAAGGGPHRAAKPTCPTTSLPTLSISSLFPLTRPSARLFDVLARLGRCFALTSSHAYTASPPLSGIMPPAVPRSGGQARARRASPRNPICPLARFTDVPSSSTSPLTTTPDFPPVSNGFENAFLLLSPPARPAERPARVDSCTARPGVRIESQTNQVRCSSSTAGARRQNELRGRLARRTSTSVPRPGPFRLTPRRSSTATYQPRPQRHGGTDRARQRPTGNWSVAGQRAERRKRSGPEKPPRPIPRVQPQTASEHVASSKAKNQHRSRAPLSRPGGPTPGRQAWKAPPGTPPPPWKIALPCAPGVLGRSVGALRGARIRAAGVATFHTLGTPNLPAGPDYWRTALPIGPGAP